MKRITVSLLPAIFLCFQLPLSAQVLPAAPPAPVVTDDGSTNADSDTPMTIDPGEPITSNEPANDEDVLGDPGYIPPENPQTAGPYEGPVGVTGIFNGNVTTACSYDPLGHSAHRVVDDIVVPGSIGKYPLKMTRYYNSRQQYYAGGGLALGPGWAHEYAWLMWSGNSKIVSPHGSVYDFRCGPPVGVSEAWEGNDWRLADGGRVHFDSATGRCTYIEDPYGQRTAITYSGDQILRVTEPGGRYLQFTYGPASDPDGTVLLTRVEAHGSGNATVTEWVNYSYTLVSAGVTGRNKMMLTGVSYSDGISATYEYRTDNVTENQTTHKMYPLLQRCDDVRYNGPMRTIRYEYENGGAHGAIINEKYPGGGAVSAITPGTGDTFTETRGDGPMRSFAYSDLVHCHGNECGACDDYELNDAYPYRAPQQMLLSYTDFQGHTTQLHYDSNWYIDRVTDAKGQTTYYAHGSPPPNGIGEILQVQHPGDNSTIRYGYESPPQYPRYDPHYITSITNERGKVTSYRRDAHHRVIRIDYPQDANTPASYEEFTYNNFGQVLTHHLRNGAYESFAYDGRGLLTDKWNPKFGTAPGGSDPHVHYTYYTAADGHYGWIDRLKNMTLPANYPMGYQASDTYEYDKNTQNQPCAGRGLVTKIRHWTANGDKIQTFGYNQFGNKLWERDELGHQTSYSYDNYNRVLTATNPLNRTETFNYLKPGTGSAYLHTTGSVYAHTSRTGIVTANVYDENFRKISSTAASGTTNAATTWFHYDAVGNQDYVTDPRGSGPGDAAHTTYTDYDARNRKWRIREPLSHTTEFHYDDHINVTRIIRPDSTTETKTYDAVNRVLTDVVPKDNTTTITNTFNYNPSGTLNWVKDGENHQTNFTYDASDQRLSMTYANNGGTQSWAYDDAHNLKSRITVGGKTQYFAYDDRNRKYAEWWTTDASNPEWRYFVRDAANRLIRAENGTQVWNNNVISDVHRSYDTANHLTLDQQIVTGLGTKNVNYPSYDDDGRLTRMYVSGVPDYDYTFSYDTMGRFQKIFITNTRATFQYHYDAASNEVQRDNLYSGVNQIYPRDNLSRTMYVTLSNTGVVREDYGYDAMNRLTSVDRVANQHDSFTYYQDGELKTAQYSAGRNVTYNLDKAGNRTSVLDTGSSRSYTPNSLNQYTAVSGCTIANGPEHEVSSFKAPNETQTVTYTYIRDERLSSANDGTNNYSMAYDALGRCVKRSLNNITTYYIYDGEKPILEYDANGTRVGFNLYGKGIDEILQRGAYGSDNLWHWYFFQQDHEGSVIALTDVNGAILEYYRYDAFGAPSIYGGPPSWPSRSTTAYDNRFLFTGREYAVTYRATHNVPAFKFYEYRARAYNPTLGRFMSEDPKLFVHRAGLGKSPDDWSFAAHPDEAELNIFRYCLNDPINNNDPTGLDSIQNADGSYSYILQHELAPQYLRGSYVEGGFSRSSVDRSPVQCARTARVLAGTALRDGWHNAPSPEGGAWRQGEAVSNNTPVGSLVAHGWEHGVYPNKNSNDRSYEGHRENINHAGIFLGLSKDGKSINVLDQYVDRNGQAKLEVRTWPRGDWSQVVSNRPYENAPTPPLLRAKE